MIKISFIFFCILIFSCKNNSESEISISTLPQEHLIDSLKLEVYKGNISAYEELKFKLLLSENSNELIFWSIYMSKEYNYKKANVDIVDCYLGNTKRFKFLSTESRMWIIGLLEEASQNNVKNSRELLEHLKGTVTPLALVCN